MLLDALCNRIVGLWLCASSWVRCWSLVHDGLFDQEDAGLRAADATRRQQGAGTQGLNWAGTWGGEGERFV